MRTNNKISCVVCDLFVHRSELNVLQITAQQIIFRHNAVSEIVITIRLTLRPCRDLLLYKSVIVTVNYPGLSL